MACKSPKQIGGGDSQSDILENDEVTANAPTNDGYWTDSGNYANSFAGGSGSSTNPYLISTPQQLARLAYLVNSSSYYRSRYYEQTANLDMSAYWWEPIGYSSSYCFSGEYDGGGYTISGIYTDSGEYDQGLFGYVEGTSSKSAEISNVGITASIIGGNQRVGGIAANATMVNITNCYNTGDIDGYWGVGGIVGRSNGYLNISNCYNTNDVGRQFNIGGILGYARENTLITNCYNAGNISGEANIGGIVGVGSGDNINISNCFNMGKTSSRYGSFGIIGGYGSGVLINYCYWGGDCTANESGGGTITNSGTCTVEEAKSLSWYLDSSNWHADYPWNFNEIWTIDTSENDGYPILRDDGLVTITFLANSGQGTMEDFILINNGSEATLPKCTFTRTGYEFSGWALSPTGVVMYSDGQTITPTASMTLYAIWRVGVYEITLNWNGGSGTWDKIYYKAGAGFYDSENCTILVSAGALIVRAERAGYSFSSFTTNANGTGTIMFQNETYMNSSTIVADDVWYAQWTVNNEAKYDSAGGYWYIENGKIPQTKVTNSTLITNLNKATTNGGNYYIAGEPLTAKVYNDTEYCKWNNNWYEVEPIRWRLTKDSNQSNGYGTETDTNAVLDKIVFVGQFSTTALGSGKGYSEDSVEEFMKNDIDTTYMIRTTKFVDTFGTGASLYGNQQFRTNFMFVSSQSEIEAVNGDLTITFSDLVKDMIKYYGGTNSYFTRDLGSNYNNITCINAVGKETQCFATNFRGLQFTVRFTEYGCVN